MLPATLTPRHHALVNILRAPSPDHAAELVRAIAASSCPSCGSQGATVLLGYTRAAVALCPSCGYQVRVELSSPVDPDHPAP